MRGFESKYLGRDGIEKVRGAIGRDGAVGFLERKRVSSSSVSFSFLAAAARKMKGTPENGQVARSAVSKTKGRTSEKVSRSRSAVSLSNASPSLVPALLSFLSHHRQKIERRRRLKRWARRVVNKEVCGGGWEEVVGCEMGKGREGRAEKPRKKKHHRKP